MATYELASPTGEKYQVNAPDDATEADVMSYFQSQTSQSTQPEKGFISDVKQAYKERVGMAQDAAEAYSQGKQTLPETYLQVTGKGVAGLANDVAGAGFSALGRGISNITPDFIEKPIVQGAKDVFNYAKNTDTGAMVGDKINQAAQSYNKFAENNPRAARNIEATLNIGNYAGALTPIKGQSAVGAALDTGKYVGGKTLDATSNLAQKALPNIDEGLVDVAKSARKYNIPLSMDEITKSRAVKTFQKASQDLPFSGQDAFRKKQLEALQGQLFDTVGVKANKFTPKNMKFAFSKVGNEFNSLVKGKNFEIGGDFIDDLTYRSDEVLSSYGKEAYDTFQREALKVVSDFNKSDTITGEMIDYHRRRLNALSRKAAPNIKDALQELEASVIDGITSKEPAIKNKLSKAKERYKNLLILEPIAAKAKGGDISPSRLLDRANKIYGRSFVKGDAGKIGELARIGYELLPELGGSDTFSKAALTGGFIGGGFVEPMTASGILVGNRALQGINRNQALVDKMLDLKPPKKQLTLGKSETKKLTKGDNK